MQDITSQAHPSIDGQPVSEHDFTRFELDRARTALLLLKEKLGPQRIEDLLADELADSDRQLTEWANASDGRFKPSTAAVEVEGGTLEGFFAWFRQAEADGDAASMLGSMPEHYVVRSPMVIETLGGYGLPAHISVAFTTDPAELPDQSAVDPDLPFRMMGSVLLRDGTKIAAVLHQLVNTEKGFKGNLCIYFPIAVPDEMVRGHQRHLACEFTNWANSYLVSAGLRDA